MPAAYLHQIRLDIIAPKGIIIPLYLLFICSNLIPEINNRPEQLLRFRRVESVPIGTTHSLLPSIGKPNGRINGARADVLLPLVILKIKVQSINIVPLTYLTRGVILRD